MDKYICMICGFIYDEAEGIPENGIAAGTKWSDVAEDFECPLCSAPKAAFEIEKKPQVEKPKPVVSETTTSLEVGALSAGVMSVLCSNLSKGFDKQYKAEESKLMNTLAEYFQKKVKPITDQGFDVLKAKVDQDIKIGISGANAIVTESHDRGALRALVWSDKVSRMVGSVLGQYEKKQKALIEDTNVYVCEICGFVYIGDEVPDICPVCKVPSMKIAQVKRR